MTKTTWILVIVAAALLLYPLVPNGYGDGDYQQLQALRAKEDAIDKQLDQAVEKRLGPQDQYRGRADDYEDDVDEVIDSNPQLRALEAEKQRLFQEQVKFAESMKLRERIDNLVYDLGSGNKTKKDLTPEEWEMLRGERIFLTKNQNQALKDAGVNPYAPVPTAEDVVGKLNRDIKEGMDKRGLGDKKPSKDEIQEDVFSAVDQFAGGINAIMGGSSPTSGSTPAVDVRSMQSGMQSMPTSTPSGGGEGHYHGPSGRDR